MQRFKKIKLTQGKYALVDAASQAYIKAAKKYHGEFARWK